MNLFKTVGLYFLAFLVVAVYIVYFLSLSMSDGRLGQIDKALWNLGVEYFCSLGMQATPDFKVPVIDRELDHALHFAVQLKDVAHNISTLLHFPVRSFGRLICSELPDMIAAAQEARILQPYTDLHGCIPFAVSRDNLQDILRHNSVYDPVSLALLANRALDYLARPKP